MACFEHFAPEIKFYSRPSYFGYSLLDWKGRSTRGYMAFEFVKLLDYWVQYGVIPFV